MNGDKNYAIYYNNEKTSYENKEVEPVQPVQMNIYQNNIYEKDFNWLHFGNETRAHKKQ